MCKNDKVTRGDLLDHYSRKDPHLFFQYDCFVEVQPDDVMSPDKDGDTLFCSHTHELMTGCVNVRVLITPETSRSDALRALKKIRKWIKRDGLYDKKAAMKMSRRLKGLEDDIPF